MYDFRELEFLILKKCKTKRNFAKIMNLSERSVHLKLKNEREFKPSEIDRACIILDIKTEEIGYYFFTKKVQFSEQLER